MAASIDADRVPRFEGLPERAGWPVCLPAEHVAALQGVSVPVRPVATQVRDAGGGIGAEVAVDDGAVVPQPGVGRLDLDAVAAVSFSEVVAQQCAGWEFVHICIDDATRLFYVELLPDEQATTCIGFLRRALRFYAAHGVKVERLMTDTARHRGGAARAPA